MAEAFGTDQESLQALLANIMASSPKEDGSGKALVADTSETSPGSAYLSSCTADFASIPALPTANGPQSMSTGQIPELVKDNSFDALLRSLQAQTQPQNQAPHSDFVDVRQAPGQVWDSPASSSQQPSNAVENLVSSFLAASHSNATTSDQQEQGNATNLVASLLKSATTRGQAPQQPPKSANELLQQLLLNQMQQKQHVPVKIPNSEDPLRSLIEAAQQQQQAAQGMGSCSQGGFGGLLQHHDTDDGSDRLGFQKASPGLGNIVNHLLSSRSKRSLPETEDPHNDDIRGFLTIPGCDDDPEFGQDLQPATDNGGNSIIGLKRAITDQGQYHGHSKAKKTSERGDEDSARKQQMQKLQDQSQTLKTANVMLSKYLEGLQGNLSEILAENWSFKILIGCLTSKQQSTNPLEQMISAKIASNPSVAIPMLKSIHLSAAASSSSQEADSAASSKDSVFQSMVGLLAAQRQGG
mmetsp:Transcript_41908/g.108509  ORF Transcript_41908/g.108509 Transcript_41908/m.108509 type:complete len:469 (-) Transcript_41908:355-1761(-)